MEKGDISIETAKTFDRVSKDFDRMRRRPWPSLGLLGSVRGRSVLDLGAGTGRNSKYFLDNGASLVVAADVSMGMLAVLGEKGWASSGLCLTRCEATNLPFVDSSFDVVAFIATLHHIPSPRGREKAVREARRVTAHGGRALITVWNPEEIPGGAKPRPPEGSQDFDVPWGKGGHRYYHMFSPEELRSLLEGSGMTVLRLFEERASPGKLGRNLVALASR